MKLYSLYLLGWRVVLFTIETEKSDSVDIESTTERRPSYDFDETPVGFVGVHNAHIRDVARR